jgi:hypothetical protein
MKLSPGTLFQLFDLKKRFKQLKTQQSNVFLFCGVGKFLMLKWYNN